MIAPYRRSMWLSLQTEIQYRFEGAIAPVAFFQSLPHILSPEDTIVLGCYDPREDIRRFLLAEEIPADERHFTPSDTFEHNRKEHPLGAAYHLRPNERILQQLSRFSESVDHHVDLCDHIAGYSSEHPVFIYHGTFWEPLFISSRVPRQKVEAFARGVGLPFEEIDFYKTYNH